MKKFLFFAAAASVALVSCVNDETMEMAPVAKKVSFDAPVFNTQTRANLYGEMYKDTKGDNLYNKTEEFVVYAVKHNGTFASTAWGGTTYMNGVKVSFNNDLNGWKDATKDWYWPEDGDYLTFGAYSPAEITGTVTKTNAGLKLTGFEVPATTATQYDLMYSDYKTDCNNGSITTVDEYNGVPLTFNHALSSIKFKIKKNAAITGTATLKSIKISGVNYKGDLSWNADGTEAWTVTNDPITTPYTVFAGATAQTFTSTEELAQDCDVLLLPQELTDDAKVEIIYTLDGTEYTKTFKLNTLANTTETVDEWKMGTRYTYIISLDAEIIYFAPKPATWTDVTGITIAL